MLYELIANHLLTDAGVVTHVNQHTYPQTLPQNFKGKGVTYRQISDADEAETVDLHSVHFQYSCYGKSYHEARLVAAAVRSAMKGFAAGDADVIIKGTSEVTFGPDFFDANTGLYITPVDAIHWIVEGD